MPLSRPYRHFASTLAVIMLLLAAPWAGATEPGVTVLTICDVYQIGPTGEQGEKGGFARLATLLDTLRAEDPEALLLLPGDFLSPSLMSSLFQGRQMVEVLNAVGISAASPGNHEFDQGWANLQERVRESRFPWIISNMTWQGQPPPGMVASQLRTIKGVEVGIFALIGPETKDLVALDEGLAIQDPFVAAKAQVADLRARGARLVIALTHLDYAVEQRLAREVAGIDLIVAGHDHIVARELIGNTLLVESGMDLEVLGKVQLTAGAPKRLEQATFLPINAAIAEQPALAAVVQGYQARLDLALDQEVGRSEVALDATNQTVRKEESNLGNLVADAVREATGADLGIINGGGLRGNRLIPPGPITRKTILGLMPFGNVVVKLRIDGQVLKAMLEHGVADWEQGKGRFPQVSGLAFTLEVHAPPGQRVRDLTVGEHPWRPDAAYTLATTDYLAEGGDGYQMLRQAEVLLPANAGDLLTTAVERKIQALGVIRAQPAGRIRLRW